MESVKSKYMSEEKNQSDVVDVIVRTAGRFFASHLIYTSFGTIARIDDTAFFSLYVMNTRKHLETDVSRSC